MPLRPASIAAHKVDSEKLRTKLFVNLLEEREVQEFLHACHPIVDSWSIGAAFCYFERAGLAASEHLLLHLTYALFIAAAMDDDYVEEQLMASVFGVHITAVPVAERSAYRDRRADWLHAKDQFFARLNYAAYLSPETLHEANCALQNANAGSHLGVLVERRVMPLCDGPFQAGTEDSYYSSPAAPRLKLINDEIEDKLFWEALHQMEVESLQERQRTKHDRNDTLEVELFPARPEHKRYAQFDEVVNSSGDAVLSPPRKRLRWKQPLPAGDIVGALGGA